MNLCNYGCEREAKFYFKQAVKWCCSNNWKKCPESKKRFGKVLKGKNIGKVSWNRGLTKENNEILRKIGEKNSGENNPMFGKRRSEKFVENLRQRMLNGGASYMNSLPIKGYRNLKEWMSNGGSSYLSSFIKRFSKDEVKLREIIKEFYPKSENTYKILNYDVDIALPEYKIAIEWDGYFHFDTEENREYHRRRQQEIEQEGWKFLRYTMFDKFPTKEQVEEDIKKLCKEI